MKNCNGNAAPDSLNVTPLFETCQENPETLEHTLHTDVCCVCEKNKSALASFASLFDSFVKFLEEHHDARPLMESDSLCSTSELSTSAAIAGCKTWRDVWLLDQGPGEKMLLIHSADLFKTLRA